MGGIYPRLYGLSLPDDFELKQEKSTSTLAIHVEFYHKSMQEQKSAYSNYRWRDTAARFHIDPLPGSEHIFVFNEVWLNERLRGRGLGGALHKYRLAIMQRALDESPDHKECHLFAFVNRDNAPERKIMARNEWEARREYGELIHYHKILVAS